MCSAVPGSSVDTTQRPWVRGNAPWLRTEEEGATAQELERGVLRRASHDAADELVQLPVASKQRDASGQAVAVHLPICARRWRSE